MKNKTYLMIIIIIAVALTTACSVEPAGEIPSSYQPVASAAQEPLQPADPGYGSSGSFSNTDISLEQMLIYAIQDEYFARSEYDYIINELGAGTPFTNIIKSEETHISMLTPLFEAYSYDFPADTSAVHLVFPSSITEALETCVEAEIDNIAMYEKFLESDLPDDVAAIFIELRDASKNHLDAFQRKLSRS
ncbi:MAG: hypothetical protein JXB33_05225 [Clostridia bacterium]|nr:hypothetical protein [Clostridia bacterium]